MSSDSGSEEDSGEDALSLSGRNLVKKAFKTSTAELLSQNKKSRSSDSPQHSQHRRNRSTSDRLHVPLKRNDHLTWLQECNKLHFALESQWPKRRRVMFEIFEDRCIRYTSAVLGMMRTVKEYKYKDVSDFVWYAEEGNPKLFAIQLTDQTQDFYECRDKDECAEIWQCLKESLRPYKNRHHHTASQDGAALNLDDTKDESQDDLFTKLHSISKEDWVDCGYLGKKAEWLMSFRTRQFRVDLTEGILEYFHPDDDVNRVRKRGRKRWWVRGHKLLLSDRSKWELEVGCATSKTSKESDHRLTIRAQDNNQFVHFVKTLHKAGAVPEDALLPDVMSSNRMGKILADKNKSISGQITRITRRFDDVTSSKISRYLDHKIKLDGSGANPRTYLEKARKILKELETSGKPSDTVLLGEMKCISKGLFGDKTERRKVSIKDNSLLCFHLIHDSDQREPRETYVIPGSAIRLYDMWNYQFTLRAFKLESSYLSKKKKIGDSTSEITIVGYHEYPEQIYSLLQSLKSGGAAICESSHYFLRLVGSFIPTDKNPRRPLEALKDAFEELERIESAKKELGWVRLTKLLTEDRIEHYMKDIKEEFNSTFVS